MRIIDNSNDKSRIAWKKNHFKDFLFVDRQMKCELCVLYLGTTFIYQIY